jgi:hypothetical protein
MAYGNVNAYRMGNQVTIVIDLPEQGEMSTTGRADNLVDPTRWIDVEDEADLLGIRMTVCRPYRRRRSQGGNQSPVRYLRSPQR